MTPKALIASALAFTLVGLGFMFSTQKSSETERVRCSEFCKTKGQGSVSAPTGTAGRLVDGGSVRTDGQSYCHCIPGDVGRKAP